jgi:hypothetical protein
VQEQLGQFNAYRNVEKPPKFMEKGNLEVLLFTLQSTMRSHNKVRREYWNFTGAELWLIGSARAVVQRSRVQMRHLPALQRIVRSWVFLPFGMVPYCLGKAEEFITKRGEMSTLTKLPAKIFKFYSEVWVLLVIFTGLALLPKKAGRLYNQVVFIGFVLLS